MGELCQYVPERVSEARDCNREPNNNARITRVFEVASGRQAAGGSPLEESLFLRPTAAERQASWGQTNAPEFYGPSPGEKGCIAPRQILKDFNVSRSHTPAGVPEKSPEKPPITELRMSDGESSARPSRSRPISYPLPKKIGRAHV